LKNQHFPTRLVSVVTAISNRLSTIKNGRPKAANSTENETRTVGDGQPAPSEECLPGAADRFRLCTSPSERGTVRVRPSGLWCAAARLCNSSPPSPETLYCRFVCLLNSERPPLGAPAAIVHCLIKVRAVPAFQPAAFLQRIQKHKLGSARSARGFGSSAGRLAVKVRCIARAQTTNLGVRSSNLFGRAIIH
jgi:hypothetical protein